MAAMGVGQTDDCLTGRKRANAIARDCSFVIDIHNPVGAGQADQRESYATGEARWVKPYDIPYGGGKISNLPLAFRATLVVSFLQLEGVALRGCESGAGWLEFQRSKNG